MIFSKFKQDKLIRSVRGFTLIEMLITMAIVGMMMSAIYAVHIANIRAVDIEEERVEIQQDQRISLDFITRQFRMAGYNKLEKSGPKIEAASSNFFYFTADFNEDGDVNDPGEHVAFCVYDSDNFGRSLSYITGNSDIGTGSVGALPIDHTHVAGQHEVFAPVEDIEFYYTYFDHATKTLMKTLFPTDLDDLRSVEVTILSRADTPDPRWTDNEVYYPASNPTKSAAGAKWGPYGDTTRRRMMTANVRFRNLGL